MLLRLRYYDNFLHNAAAFSALLISDAAWIFCWRVFRSSQYRYWLAWSFKMASPTADADIAILARIAPPLRSDVFHRQWRNTMIFSSQAPSLRAQRFQSVREVSSPSDSNVADFTFTHSYFQWSTIGIADHAHALRPIRRHRFHHESPPSCSYRRLARLRFHGRAAAISATRFKKVTGRSRREIRFGSVWALEIWRLLYDASWDDARLYIRRLRDMLIACSSLVPWCPFLELCSHYTPKSYFRMASSII